VAWLAELANEEDSYFICDRLGRFIAHTASVSDRRTLLQLFDEGTSEQKHVLSCYVLGRLPNLKLEELSDGDIAWLIEDLKVTKQSPRLSVLASVATEALMEEAILPLLDGASDILRENIDALAEDIGQRHGRRYLATNSGSLELDLDDHLYEPP
jgi:hypothetical protein